MLILRIYGARTILLIFCCHQDTELESREENILSDTLLTHKNTPNYIWENDIHTIQHGRIILL